MGESTIDVIFPKVGRARRARRGHASPGTSYASFKAFPRLGAFGERALPMICTFLLVTLWTASAFADSDLAGTVIHPSDGGVVEIQPEGQKQLVTIKLIGVEVPVKSTRDAEGQEPWGTRAQQFLSLQVTRKNVRVEFDVQTATDTQAKWGYLWVGDKLMNEELLRAGHAVLDTRPPNVKYAERLQAAQHDAREKQAGIWDPKEPLPEQPGKFSAEKHDAKRAAKTLEADNSIPAWQPGCVIGNRKTKKFHVGGGRYYESAKKGKNAIFFKTAEDAQKAGYVKSGE